MKIQVIKLSPMGIAEYNVFMLGERFFLHSKVSFVVGGGQQKHRLLTKCLGEASGQIKTSLKILIFLSPLAHPMF